MYFFKKKIQKEDEINVEGMKKLPTYYEKYSKNIKIKNNSYVFQLKNNSEEEFEIYYYGDLLKNKFIVEKNDARSLVVAKDKYGNEIVLFDGFTHGYYNLAWQEYDKKELNIERVLKKLDIGFVKVFIGVELLDDNDDDWDLDSDNNVTGDNNKKTPWDIFKRNAITSLTINVVTGKNKKINIVDEELA